MAGTPLHNELANANATAVRDTMSILKKHWKLGAWLSNSNPYRKDSYRYISRIAQKGSILKGTAAPQYVAASAIAHCFDGWSYLGRALEAEMAGDPDTARHMGYYAELRAAMSVLASEGIGVFQNRHIVVVKENQSNILKGNALKHQGKARAGTHEFVWVALNWWADSQEGTSAILKLIKPGGVRLSEWLRQFSAGSKFLASHWLKQWGLDLSRLVADRDARNMASYRPTGFTTPGPRSISSIMENILQIWEVCDPGAIGGFPILDCHLLRSSLNLVLNHLDSTGKRKYAQTLSTVLNGIGPTSQPLGPWNIFLSQPCLVDKHSVIDNASGKVGALHVDHSKQVLARAILLLRIATGSSAELLLEAGLDGRKALEFWKHDASVRRRLWPDTSTAFSSVDLWADIESARDSIEDWLQSGGPLCHHALWTKKATEASLLSTAERAFLWGVGL